MHEGKGLTAPWVTPKILKETRPVDWSGSIGGSLPTVLLLPCSASQISPWHGVRLSQEGESSLPRQPVLQGCGWPEIPFVSYF